jgi:RNA polymerase sigma factor (TIGR02999 family)
MVLNESITHLLVQWNEGDKTALEKLTPFVYDELRRLAQHYLQSERPDHTLQATALVHEAFLKLLEMPQIDWQNRSHFIGLAANMMRRVLVDHARRHRAEKRGGKDYKLPISRAEHVGFQANLDLVALDESLQKLTEDFPRKAHVVELRFFGGLNNEEIVGVLSAGGTKTSLRTVERDWEFARAWLFQQLSGTEKENGRLA